MKRYSVLTYIFNGYEKLREVEEVDPEAEYICITDDADMKSDTWTIVVDPMLENLSVFDKCYQVRFFPFKYCNTDICIRLDGDILIKKSCKELIDAFESNNIDFALMIHPFRNTQIQEYIAWQKLRGYPQSQIEKCLDFMLSLNYDIIDYKGLYEGGFAIQRNNKNVNLANSFTFNFLKYLGENDKIERIDQTIFSFVINRFFEGKIKVMPLSRSILTDSQFFQLYNHNSDEKIPDFPNKIEPYLFNKKVEFVKF